MNNNIGNNKIGIRREYKNNWERRTPLTPQAVRFLCQKGFNVAVQKSPVRIFKDSDYLAAGAELVDSVDQCDVVLGIKEPKIDEVKPSQTHLAFSHTIKGQSYNMPLLRHFLDVDATLIDYELLTNDQGLRTLAFGRFAGIAGAVDTFWVYARKKELEGAPVSFSNIKQTYQYEKLDALFKSLHTFSPLKDSLRVCVTGGGNVSKGAEEVCKALGLQRKTPEEVLESPVAEGSWYFVVDIPDFMKHKEGHVFRIEEYFQNGANSFESIFYTYLGSFDILLHGAYWDPRYPRILPKEVLKSCDESKRPLVIGDISCDIHGSIESTDRATTIDNPSCTYFPDTDTYESGTFPDGVTFMSIDNLPCELSVDSSEHFSKILVDLVPYLVTMNKEDSLDALDIPPILKRAIITHQGSLVPSYAHLNP